MDVEFLQNLVETLRKVTAPDTKEIQEASKTLQKDFYENENIVLALIRILQTHSEVPIRQLAGVEARKLIDSTWDNLPEGTRHSIKSNLVQTTMAEPESIVRNTSSRIISTIGKKESDDDSWPELWASLSEYLQSSKVVEREVSVYILYTLLEADYRLMVDQAFDLLKVFSVSINDPESLQVRVSTIMALGEISSVLSSFSRETYSNIEIFQSIVPSMVDVLKKAIDVEDENAVKQIFEVFSSFLITDSSLTAKHFGGLVTFVLCEIAGNKQLSEAIRVPALQYIINAVKSKKTRIQNLKLGPRICTTAMNIIADYYEQNEEDLDKEDENELSETNSRTVSLQLIDHMSSNLPPTQVNTTLIQLLNEFSKSGSSAKARAGFMALAYAIEGATEFFAGHIKGILHLVIAGLQQPDLHIQSAALFALYYLGCELREMISDEHEILLPLVFNIMETAKNIKVGKNAFHALDSILECIDRRVITEKYLDTLVPKLLSLFSSTANFYLKSLIGTALSSTAFSAGKCFIPYFPDTIKALEPFISLSQNIDALPQEQVDLCASTLDTVGSIAASVGRTTFRPYVEVLVESAYRCMQAKSSRARESGYICVGTLAKLYGPEFAPIAPKLIEEIYTCLEQDEFGKVPITAEDVGIEEHIGSNATKFEASSALAVEKEHATETLGDLIQACRTDFPDIEEGVRQLSAHTQHYSDGLRKTSISCLWRTYITWVVIDQEGRWSPGLPATEHANSSTAYIAQLTREETLNLLELEVERDVAIFVCQKLAEGLKIIGPRVLLNNENLDLLVDQLSQILNKQHCCQSGVEDDFADEIEDYQDENSEYDGLLFEAAFDVAVQTAASIGVQFTSLFPIFLNPITKFCLSAAPIERAIATGALSEIVNAMGSNITGFTTEVMGTLMKALCDNNLEVRTNAAYGVGLVCYYSKNTFLVTDKFHDIMHSLERLFKKADKSNTRTVIFNSSDSENNSARGLANACGCVARMIIKHPNEAPISDIVKRYLDVLPLTEGMEENIPIFEAFIQLFKTQNPTVVEHRVKIVEIFSKIFAQEAAGKLELRSDKCGVNDVELPFETDAIRNKVIDFLKFLEAQYAGLVSSHQNLAPFLIMN